MNVIRQVTGMKNHVLFAVVVKKIEIMTGKWLQGNLQKQNAKGVVSLHICHLVVLVGDVEKLGEPMILDFYGMNMIISLAKHHSFMALGTIFVHFQKLEFIYLKIT